MKQEVKKYFSQFPKYFSGFHVYCGARNADLPNCWKSSLAIVGDTGISSVMSINQQHLFIHDKVITELKC